MAQVTSTPTSISTTRQEENGADERTFSLSDFDVGHSLGKGRFGHVYRARVKATAHIVAIKIMDKRQIESEGAISSVRHEVEIQSRLRHPNILRQFAHFVDRKRVFLVLEYAEGGELFDRLTKAGRFDDATAASYIAQIANAVLYLHAKKIIHRDLKPENILLAADGTIKLCDFGHAVISPRDRRHTLVGTLDYLPSEVTESRPYGSAVDRWTLGVLLYEFLVGQAPFYADDQTDTVQRIRNLEYTIPDHVHPLAQDLIKRLLQREPEERCKLEHVLVHPYLTTLAPETVHGLWMSPDLTQVVQAAKRLHESGELFAPV
ncbi:kinase-like domain-containing protein [Blastocladiella britannica]|nr:kinase-like domain-containing protein [Blastocladiella britannica]